MPISKTSVLRRTDDLEIKIHDNSITINHASQPYKGSSQTLGVLDVFAKAITFGAGLDLLAKRATGQLEWISMTQEVLRLHDHGILTCPDQLPRSMPSHPGKFTAADVHIRMLNDRARTSAFQRAIHASVTTDDVVLDIGTGTGVLAATAALAGARHVYAIEQNRTFAALAREFFERNNLADKITVIEGNSQSASLPEKASVLVSEIIGNDALDEGILSTFCDARKRLLHPDARLIPQRLQIHALPLSMPAEKRAQHVFTEQAATRWQENYSMDFSTYTEFCSSQSFSTTASSSKVRHWYRLADPVLCADLNLETDNLSSRLEESQITSKISNSGSLNGMLLFWTADLRPGHRLSVAPDEADPDNSWGSHIWIPGEAINVRQGQQLTFTYMWNAATNRSEIKITSPQGDGQS